MPCTVIGAGTGDSAPKKCSASDIEYVITNVAPTGVCNVISDTIQVDFNVEIWGNPTRYNLAVGYTNAGDNILQDVACLATGIDIDSVGCDDYDGSGTTAAPFIAQSSFSVSCDLDGNLLVDPLVGVDFYVSFDANQGGTVAEITSPKCLLQEGNTFPMAPAKLTLLKTVTNDSGGSAAITDWTLTAAQIGGNTALSGLTGVSSDTLPAGAYTLTESGLAGYTLDSISCTGAVYDAASATLTLEPAEAATCTFNNNDDVVTTPTANLTLIKNVINDDGGNSVADDFQLAINGTQVNSGAVTSVNAGIDLTISEQSIPAYSNGTWSCVDNNGLSAGLPLAGAATGTSLNLAAGADVVCTIENNDIGAVQTVDLSVVKSVNNMSPSIGEVVTFSLLVGNAGPDIATTITVSDVVPAGFAYVAGTIAGGDAQQDSDPQGAGLQWTINSLAVGGTSTVTFDAMVLVP